MHSGWICFLNQCFVGTENQETESGHSVVPTHRVLSRSLNALGFFVSSFGVLSHCRSPPSPVIRKNSNFRITEENMKTPRDFDYDIWKDDSGYYYIRVKRTGETARVSKDVVRELWRDMYRMEKYRQNATMTDKDGSRHARILSLDDNRAVNRHLYPVSNESWLISRENAYEEIELDLVERDFIKTLTEKQRQVYQIVMKEGRSISECAKLCGISPPSVINRLALIQKKARRFFHDT